MTMTIFAQWAVKIGKAANGSAGKCSAGKCKCLVCFHVTRHNEIPSARFSQIHVLDFGVTKLNVVALLKKHSRLDVPSTIIHQLQYWIPFELYEMIHNLVLGSQEFTLQFPPVQTKISKGPLEGPIQSD